jgi:predicted negative regulator of RcsB-dependent stress response
VPGHISPKELKRDRFVETMEHGAEYAAAHARNLWIAVGVAALIMASVFGWRFWSDQQSQKAGVAMDDALKVFEARLRAPAEPQEPGEVTYLIEKTKYTDARKKFDEVAQKYSLTSQGTWARYYSALCSERLGENDKASAALRDLSTNSNAEVAALAKLVLADLAEQSGKNDEAAQLLQGLVEHPTTLVPRARAEMALADLYRRAKPAEAAKLYEQIKKEFPDSPLSDEADKRLAELAPAS